ncbi:hypothetical protein MTR11_23775 [Vibrio sp. CCB-PB317]|nr:hypothetical protein [Vibrio sp. CCB-PB317]
MVKVVCVGFGIVCLTP